MFWVCKIFARYIRSSLATKEFPAEHFYITPTISWFLFLKCNCQHQIVLLKNLKVRQIWTLLVKPELIINELNCIKKYLKFNYNAKHKKFLWKQQLLKHHLDQRPERGEISCHGIINGKRLVFMRGKINLLVQITET